MVYSYVESTRYYLLILNLAEGIVHPTPIDRVDRDTVGWILLMSQALSREGARVDPV